MNGLKNCAINNDWVKDLSSNDFVIFHVDSKGAFTSI